MKALEHRMGMRTARMVLAGALLGGGMLLAPSGVRADEVAKSFAVSGHAHVRVQTDDGSVRVSTGDIKQVEIRVEYTGYKLDRDLQVSTSQNGDSVEVVAKTRNGGDWVNFGVRHSRLGGEGDMPEGGGLGGR